MRLVNNHTAPLPTAQATGEVRVAPGHTGDFNVENPSVKLWIAHRWLLPEGEVLASKASAFIAAPGIAEIATLRADIEKRDTVIEDLRQRDASRIAEMKRIEERFAELAAAHGNADALVAENAALKAHITELETMVATLTAPPATDPKTEGGKATRKG